MTEEAAPSKKPLWRETGGEKRVLEARAAKEALVRRLTEGLAKCPVCKGSAKIVLFGLRGNGVWVGCDKTEECSRYIERHLEGWSIEDTVADWNRRNKGWRKWARGAKRWYRVRFGSEERAKKRVLRELKAKKEEELAKRRARFGILPPKKAKRWWKFW